jgi:hypothetical protein
MVHGNRITVQGLVKDWQAYTIYFTGHGRGHPSAVLFKQFAAASLSCD